MRVQVNVPPEFEHLPSLQNFMLKELTLADVKGITFEQVIFNMNEETRENLNNLDITGMIDLNVSDLGRLSNLNSLNISCTHVTSDGLDNIITIILAIK
ncbi:hypothetical protein ACTXT7_012173 [Hymenolepis weldensis]